MYLYRGMKRIDLTGTRYGRLVVVEFDKTDNRGIAFWKCRCDCGNVISITSASVRYGLSKSCGCLAKELTSVRSRRHGEARLTKEYRAWAGLKARCYTPSDQRYNCYGALGIIVCDRWRNSYGNFLQDMGRAPTAAHSIDRLDVTGNYEPSNCRWATDSEQANNKRNTVWIEHDGKRLSLRNWATVYSVDYKRLHKLVRTKGMPFAEAVSFIPKIILPIALILFLSGCSQRYFCKKCLDGGKVIHDTLTVKQDVITERVKMDTIVEVRTKTDTVTIREKNLVIRYKKLAGDTVFLSGECEPDSIRVEIRVPVPIKVETGLAPWKAGGLIVLAIVIGALIGKLLT